MIKRMDKLWKVVQKTGVKKSTRIPDEGDDPLEVVKTIRITKKEDRWIQRALIKGRNQLEPDNFSDFGRWCIRKCLQEVADIINDPPLTCELAQIRMIQNIAHAEFIAMQYLQILATTDQMIQAQRNLGAAGSHIADLVEEQSNEVDQLPNTYWGAETKRRWHEQFDKLRGLISLNPDDAEKDDPFENAS